MSLSKEATSKLFSVKYINCKRRYGMWKKFLFHPVFWPVLVVPNLQATPILF